jgi:hypothetical protein
VAVKQAEQCALQQGQKQGGGGGATWVDSVMLGMAREGGWLLAARTSVVGVLPVQPAEGTCRRTHAITCTPAGGCSNDWYQHTPTPPDSQAMHLPHLLAPAAPHPSPSGCRCCAHSSPLTLTCGCPSSGAAQAATSWLPTCCRRWSAPTLRCRAAVTRPAGQARVRGAASGLGAPASPSPPPPPPNSALLLLVARRERSRWREL